VRLFPQKTKAVVIVDSFIAKTPAMVTRAALTQNQQRVKSLSGPSGEKSFVRQVNAMFSDRTTPEMQDEIRTKMLATPVYVRAAAVTSISTFPPSAPLDDFQMPALAVVSSYSAARAAEMRPIFPKLEVERWDNYGHFLMMEDPERFNETFERFLAAHP
jgi:pimeloyl-ACP methyl ester carboxylesterase